MSNSSTSDNERKPEDPIDRIAEHEETLEWLAEQDEDEVPLAYDAKRFLNILEQEGRR